MPAPLSACIVLYHCGDEVKNALRCLEQSNVEVAVYLCDNSPEEMTADQTLKTTCTQSTSRRACLKSTT